MTANQIAKDQKIEILEVKIISFQNNLNMSIITGGLFLSVINHETKNTVSIKPSGYDLLLYIITSRRAALVLWTIWFLIYLKSPSSDIANRSNTTSAVKNILNACL